MPTHVLSGFTRIRLLSPAEAAGDEHLIRLTGYVPARTFLARFISDHAAMETLRGLYAERVHAGAFAAVSDHEVLDALARMINAGEIYVAAYPAFRPSGVARRREQREPELAGPPVEIKASWIEIELVDSQGKPVPNERYRITMPSGETRNGKLDQNGLGRVDEIDPGMCTVTFPDLDASVWQRA